MAIKVVAIAIIASSTRAKEVINPPTASISTTN